MGMNIDSNENSHEHNRCVYHHISTAVASIANDKYYVRQNTVPHRRDATACKGCKKVFPLPRDSDGSKGKRWDCQCRAPAAACSRSRGFRLRVFVFNNPSLFKGTSILRRSRVKAAVLLLLISKVTHGSVGFLGP